MKKIIIFLAIVAILVPLSSCGAETSQIHKARNKAVEISDNVLNNEITVKEAKEWLDNIYIPETEGHGSLFLKNDISWLSFCLTKRDFASFEERVESMRNRNYEDKDAE